MNSTMKFALICTALIFWATPIAAAVLDLFSWLLEMKLNTGIDWTSNQGSRGLALSLWVYCGLMLGVPFAIAHADEKERG